MDNQTRQALELIAADSGQAAEVRNEAARQLAALAEPESLDESRDQFALSTADGEPAPPEL
jgi:hypothetical protein